jgi:predicted CopG family antitoxin
MASKTINIDAELYQKLKERKKNHSFTEYIRLLLENYRPSPKEFFGILEENELSYDEIKKERKTKDVAL